MSEKTINREMTIESILSLFPNKAQKLAQEITNAGLHCIGCGAATWETLEAGMLTHGKTENEIINLTERLNNLLKEQEEEMDKTAVHLTERAAKKFLEILANDEKQGWGLRFGDRMSGCSGFEYILDFAEKATDNDKTFLSHGVEIYVDKDSEQRLLGCVVDYVDGLQGAGFKVSNPNARSSCGCGSSHGY
ncbi:iron-sulfur cluster assembly accessory protein [Chlamydiales bacterium]|nr:iron-sulfur cluster assembly accessory protein [Chlamydiales bacterium]